MLFTNGKRTFSQNCGLPSLQGQLAKNPQFSTQNRGTFFPPAQRFKFLCGPGWECDTDDRSGLELQLPIRPEILPEYGTPPWIITTRRLTDQCSRFNLLLTNAETVAKSSHDEIITLD
jgi:hypothetical protein